MHVDVSGPLLSGLQHEVTRLHEALDNRTIIGQATGILMERYDYDTGQAFAALIRLSEEQRRTPLDVAYDLVHHRAKS